MMGEEYRTTHPAPTSPPAGYYRDPSGLPVERWWDGGEWTDTTRPLVEQEPQPTVTTLQPPWDWKRIFSFKARTRRSEYLAALAIAWGVSFVGGFIDGYLGVYPESMFFMLIGVVAAAGLALGASVNRLHDMGYSGWLALLIFVPVVFVGVFLWLAIQQGQAQPNQWGPPVGGPEARRVPASPAG